MPPPPKFGGPPVTNIRNSLVPSLARLAEAREPMPCTGEQLLRYAEYAPEPNPETRKKDVVWFALNESWPLFAFAGIWTEFKGGRGTKSKRTRMRNAWRGLGDRWNKRPASCLIMKNSEDHLWSGRD